MQFEQLLILASIGGGKNDAEQSENRPSSRGAFPKLCASLRAPRNMFDTKSFQAWLRPRPN